MPIISIYKPKKKEEQPKATIKPYVSKARPVKVAPTKAKPANLKQLMSFDKLPSQAALESLEQAPLTARRVETKPVQKYPITAYTPSIQPQAAPEEKPRQKATTSYGLSELMSGVGKDIQTVGKMAFEPFMGAVLGMDIRDGKVYTNVPTYGLSDEEFKKQIQYSQDIQSGKIPKEQALKEQAAAMKKVVGVTDPVEHLKSSIKGPVESAKESFINLPLALAGNPQAQKQMHAKFEANPLLYAVERGVDYSIAGALLKGLARAGINRIPAERMANITEAVKVYTPEEVTEALIHSTGPAAESVKPLSGAERSAASKAGLGVTETTTTPKYTRLRKFLQGGEYPVSTEVTSAQPMQPKPAGFLPAAGQTTVAPIIKPYEPPVVKPNVRYRAFDVPEEALGNLGGDVSFSRHQNSYGGAYEIEIVNTTKAKKIPHQPDAYRGSLEGARITKVFYEPEYWAEKHRKTILSKDLPRLKKMFPDAEFVRWKRGSDAETMTPIKDLEYRKYLTPETDEAAELAELENIVNRKIKMTAKELEESASIEPQDYITRMKGVAEWADSHTARPTTAKELEQAIIAKGKIKRSPGILEGEYRESIPLRLKNNKTGMYLDEISAELGYESVSDMLGVLSGKKKSGIDFTAEAERILEEDPMFSPVMERYYELVNKHQQSALADLAFDEAGSISLGGEEVRPVSEVEALIDEMVAGKEKVNIPELVSKAKTTAELQLIDRFMPLKKIAKKVEMDTGNVLPAHQNPYVQAQLYGGAPGVTKAAVEDLRSAFTGVRQYRKELIRYVLARRAAQRDIILNPPEAQGKAFETKFVNPNRVTIGEAQKAIENIKKTVGDETFSKIEQAAEYYQKSGKRWQIDFAVDTGLISKELGAELSKYWYAPFHVADYIPDNINKVPHGKGIFSMGKQPIVKRMKGTERKITDPLEATIIQYSRVIDAGYKNLVSKSLFNLRNIDPALKDVIVPMRKSQSVPKGWKSFNYMENGLARKYMVPAELGEAMESVSAGNMGTIESMLGNTSKILKTGATGMNVAFAVRNPVRDVGLSILATEHPLDPISFAQGFGHAAATAFGFPTSMYREYLLERGGFSGIVGRSAAQINVKKLFEPREATFAKTVLNPFQLVRAVGETSELMTRLGVYAKAKKMGSSPMKSALESRRGSIDFWMGGKTIKGLEPGVPFLSARVNALTTMLRAARNNPSKFTLTFILKIMAPWAGTYFYNRMFHSDTYDEIPDYEKDSSFIIVLGKKKDPKTGKYLPNYIRIPKPDAAKLIINPLEGFLDYAFTKDPKTAGEIAIQWLSNLSPVSFERRGKLDPGMLLASLNPALRVPFELYANKVLFTNRPIVPEKLTKAERREQYDETTSPLAKLLGKVTGTSPMALEYTAKGAAAGLGSAVFHPLSFITSAGETYSRSRGGEMETKAYEVRDDMELGYSTARIRAERAYIDNKPDQAIKIMEEWNKKVPKHVERISNLGVFPADEVAKTQRRYTFDADDINRMIQRISKQKR